MNQPTPAPLPGGELATVAQNVAPLLGGARGGFRGSMRELVRGILSMNLVGQTCRFALPGSWPRFTAAFRRCSLSMNRPTPAPLPGGEHETAAQNVAPLLGGARGGFRGSRREIFFWGIPPVTPVARTCRSALPGSCAGWRVWRSGGTSTAPQEYRFQNPESGLMILHASP